MNPAQDSPSFCAVTNVAAKAYRYHYVHLYGVCCAKAQVYKPIVHRSGIENNGSVVASPASPIGVLLCGQAKCNCIRPAHTTIWVFDETAYETLQFYSPTAPLTLLRLPFQFCVNIPYRRHVKIIQRTLAIAAPSPTPTAIIGYILFANIFSSSSLS